jgi:hypothetical protein
MDIKLPDYEMPSESPVSLSQFFHDSDTQYISESQSEGPMMTDDRRQTYADVVMTSSPVSVKVPTSIKVNKVNKAKRMVEEITKVKCIYLTGLPYLKVGRLRHHLGSLHFHLQSIQNLSYIGKRVVECLIKESDYRTFYITAKRNKLGVHEKFDPLDPSDHSLDVHLSEYRMGKTLNELREMFIERITKEALSSNSILTEEFYRTWTEKVNYDGLFKGSMGKFHSKVLMLANFANF